MGKGHSDGQYQAGVTERSGQIFRNARSANVGCPSRGRDNRHNAVCCGALVRFWGEADMARPPLAYRPVADDPQEEMPPISLAASVGVGRDFDVYQC